MKRKALITLILGTALAIAPAAHALVPIDGSDSGSTATVTISPADSQAFGAPVTLRPDILGGDGRGSTSPISTSTGDSFPWNAAIGGTALLGAMLLALGFAVVNRRRRQLSF